MDSSQKKKKKGNNKVKNWHVKNLGSWLWMTKVIPEAERKGQELIADNFQQPLASF